MSTSPQKVSSGNEKSAPGDGGQGRAGWADRVPPHDIEAEMSLLGSLMLDRNVAAEILQIVPRHEAGRFYQVEHQLVYEVLIDLYDRASAVDLVIVRDELMRRDLLDKIGGVDYLVQLVESVPSSAHAEYYAKIVRDKALLRDMIACAGELIDLSYSARKEVHDLLDEAERKFFAVTERRVSVNAATLSSLLEETFRQIQDRDENSLTGLSTGFYELNELLSGLQASELIIVAGRPSMGKTALGLNIAEHLATTEHKGVVFFSMEMSRQQVAQRIMCSRADVDSQKLRRSMLGPHEIGLLQTACDQMQDAPLFIDDTPSMTILELRAKARRMSVQHGVSAIFVDYMQLMYCPGLENRQQEIATISRGLKALARELNIPVVAVSQLNRSPEGREGHRPRVSDLRESGAIEQDADVVLLLHRPSYYDSDDKPGVAELIIAKQRNGPTGSVKLTFDQRTTRFKTHSSAEAPDEVASGVTEDVTPF